MREIVLNSLINIAILVKMNGLLENFFNAVYSALGAVVEMIGYALGYCWQLLSASVMYRESQILIALDIVHFICIGVAIVWFALIILRTIPVRGVQQKAGELAETVVLRTAIPMLLVVMGVRWMFRNVVFAVHVESGSWNSLSIFIGIALVLVILSLVWSISIIAPAHMKSAFQMPLEWVWNKICEPIYMPVQNLVIGFFMLILNILIGIRKFVLPTYTERVFKECVKLAKKVCELESEYAVMSDGELQMKTSLFRDRLNKGETLDDILVEAFATAREAAWRIRRERPFFCQIIGAIVLHRGMVAEMSTGEGKTLTATMAVYLNALTGLGVHVITVNEYLAQRDADNMGRVFKFLGLTVGCIKDDMNTEWKKEVYNSDVVYCTSHAVAFDYLKDNMQTELSQIVLRGFHYAIIDELDKVLLDDANTPLIISGEAVESSALCEYADAVAKKFVPEDYEIEAKSRNIHFTTNGFVHLEDMLRADGVLDANDTVFSSDYILLMHHINQALRANVMFEKDVQYVVVDGEVQIIDESTGRIMHNNRYSEGLHQALEAKERVEIQKENQTVATITYQKFFDMYEKKSGMTGTAYSEREELLAIYGLHVIKVPTNKPLARIDMDDEIYLTFDEKLEALIKMVEDATERKQPVLIGTGSVEKSEEISFALTRAGIKHKLLNAKNPAQEAEIIAQAGRLGAVTVAAKMAGRGTDIKLGGNVDFMIANIPEPTTELMDKLHKDVEEEAKEVLKTGGLLVIGTERDLNVRIDNQLKGRAGRQGDKGMSIFMISLDDPLMERMNGASLARWFVRVGHKHGEVLVDPWVTKSIAKAQQRMESYFFDMRKNVLRYDNVITDQSHYIYGERYKFMTNENVFDTALHLMNVLVEELLHKYFKDEEKISDEKLVELAKGLKQVINFDINVEDFRECANVAEVKSKLVVMLQGNAPVEFAQINDYARYVCLTTIDNLWTKHLTGIENLRHGIQLRGYGQKDPVNEFKKEAFTLFELMLERFKETVVRRVFVEMSEQ